MPVVIDTQNQTGSDGQLSKKPKTEAQRARERARRKRRRQNKLQKEVFSAGSDLPLVLSAKQVEQAGFEPLQDLPFSGEPGLADDIPPAEDVDQDTFDDLAKSEPAEPGGPMDFHETVDVPEYEPPAPEILPPSDMDDSQRIFEEGIQPQDENIINEENLKQADELAQVLKAEQGDSLEEIPHKQGLFGRFFDLLVQLTQKNKEHDTELLETSAPEIVMQQEGQTSGGGIWFGILKFLVGLVVILALGIGAFWLGSSLKVIDLFNSWFAPKASELELVIGDNAEVAADQDLLEKWGFQTAQTAGNNMGNLNDLAYNIFFNANYFGRLKDPMFITETGVTAALYYGFGRENLYFRNKFVLYVKFLANLQNSNQVKIADVLDRQVRRDEALDSFIKETAALFEEGNTYRKEIATQVDGLKISVNSLNPDKDRYETDFFAALEATKAEKADVLIKSFVDVTQKQVELKAKLAAMTQLYDYYESELIDIKLRLEAIKKNREALIIGVSVTETPGVDLNLIRQ